MRRRPPRSTLFRYTTLFRSPNVIKDNIKTLKDLIDDVEQVKGFVSDIVLLEYYKKGIYGINIDTIDYIKDILSVCYQNDELNTEDSLTLLKCKIVENFNSSIRMHLLNFVKEIVVKIIITHQLQKSSPDIKSHGIDSYINKLARAHPRAEPPPGGCPRRRAGGKSRVRRARGRTKTRTRRVLIIASQGSAAAEA